MPCPRDGSADSLSTGEPVKDWAGLSEYTPLGVFRPGGLPDIVAVIQSIEAGTRRERRAKTVGSVGSLSTAPKSDAFVIKTQHLNRHLSRPHPLPPTTLSSERFRSGEHNTDLLAAIVGSRTPEPGKHWIHVEAGIKVHQLLHDLDSMGLALPTMGASGFQSLAGALATGTHGSDFNLKPLSDAIQAIHLVGPTGHEWWVERSEGFGDASAYGALLPNWCDDTLVVRDTDFFNAAMVSIGRLGVIYSLVLQVGAQYRLREERRKERLLDALELDPLIRGINDGSVFERPHPDTDEPLRHLQIIIEATKFETCWIIERWETDSIERIDVDKGFCLVCFLCKRWIFRGSFFALMLLIFGPLVALAGVIFLGIEMALGIAGIFAPKWARRLRAKIARARKFATRVLAAAVTEKTFGGFIARFVNAAREAGYTELVLAVMTNALDTEYPEVRQGNSHEILDGYNYDRDTYNEERDELEPCFSVNAAEFFFDANEFIDADRPSAPFVAFLNEVKTIALDLGPIAGMASLRFTRASEGKLAMQRFERTVAIEVGIVRPGDNNQEFMRQVHQAAARHGGIPHWGLEHDLDAAAVELLYGVRLEDFRWALAETEGIGRAPSIFVGLPDALPPAGDDNRVETFSSDFSRSRGLQALRPLAEYQAERYGGVIVAAAT